MTDKAHAFKDIKWIPVKNLSVVWAGAQRPLNAKHAKNIADQFDPEMFGTLAVTKPNGHGIYHVIDGHHRKVAIESLWGKDETVPCQVYDAEDPARAAKLFDHINTNRRSLQPMEIFRVRVTGKNELQVGVNEVVIECGYNVGSRAENSIACVSALEAVYQTSGPIVLKNVLRLIDKVWGKDKSANAGTIVRGFGLFLSEHRNVDFDRLVAVVAGKYTPARLLGAAKTAREMNGGSTATAVSDLMVATYNATVRSDKLKLKSKKK